MGMTDHHTRSGLRQHDGASCGLDTAVITGDDRFAGKVAERPILERHIRRVQDFVG
jgi:hypothetical protein